jgi:O-antigen/teichoic acid export membrane protein
MSSAFASWSSTNFYYPLLSTWSGMAQAGEMKALLNLTAPISQTMASLSMLAVPYAARAGSKNARRLSGKLTVVFLGSACLYWCFVLPMQSRVVHVLYPGGAYNGIIPLIPLFALISILNSAFNAPAAMLRGLNFPASVFTARVWGGVISLAIGIPATWIFALKGATIGQILASLITFVIGKLLLDRKLANFSEPARPTLPETQLAAHYPGVPHKPTVS